jgi:serine protease Do
MKPTFFAVVLVAGAVAVPFVARPLAQGAPDPDRLGRGADFTRPAGRGSEIGVQVVDGKDSGVLVEDVRPDSPADKAGVKRQDVIVEFDGEHVRGVRQFTRLVQETPANRTVKATVLRDGQKRDVQITPREGRGVLGALPDVDSLRERMPDFDALRNLPYTFDFAAPLSGRRLGVDVDPLTSQLAQYFGAKDGLLVRSVAEGSAAARAGLRAGDVIASIDGHPVRSREDLVRELRQAKDEELTIGIVRDKKESSVKAKIEQPRRTTRRRPA